MKFALTSETSSASEIGKGIYNGKNKIGKTVSVRSTIVRENAELDKQTLQQNIDWFTILIGNGKFWSKQNWKLKIGLRSEKASPERNFFNETVK